MERQLPERLQLNICLKCRYDLTGHAVFGRCPECGVAFNRDHPFVPVVGHELRTLGLLELAVATVGIGAAAGLTIMTGASAMPVIMLGCVLGIGLILHGMQRRQAAKGRADAYFLIDEEGLVLVSRRRKGRLRRLLRWNMLRSVELRRRFHGWSLRPRLRLSIVSNAHNDSFRLMTLSLRDAAIVRRRMRQCRRDAKHIRG